MAAVRRRHAVVALLATGGALTCAAVAASVLPIAGSAASGQFEGSFELFQHDTSQQPLDFGEPGPSVGDQFVFGGDVSTRQGGPKVGRMAGQCTNSSDTEILCSAAFTIGRDQITYQGIAETTTFYGGRPTDFAITGGTGRFRKASGILTGRILPNGADAVFTVALR